MTASRSKPRSRAKVSAECACRVCSSDGRSCTWSRLPLPRFGNYVVGLIAELGSNLPMRRHHLGWREDLFAVAGIVRGNLRGFWPAESAAGDGLDDLLAARTGGVKILLGSSP